MLEFLDSFDGKVCCLLKMWYFDLLDSVKRSNGPSVLGDNYYYRIIGCIFTLDSCGVIDSNKCQELMDELHDTYFGK
jgi:hypothetical protein